MALPGVRGGSAWFGTNHLQGQCSPLKAEFAVGTEPHQLQHGVIRLAVQQHQVRFDMTIPMIVPITGQGVVPMFGGQWLVIR